MAKTKVQSTTTRNEQAENARLNLLGQDFYKRIVPAYGEPNLEALRAAATNGNTSPTATSAPNYSKVVMAEIARTFTDHKSYIEGLKKKANEYREASRLSFAPYLAEFQEWAMSLVPDITIEFTGKGHSAKADSAKEAVRGTVDAWLGCMTNMSNQKLRGEAASENRAAKKGAFSQAARGRKVVGLKISNTEQVKGELEMSYYAEDEGELVRKFLFEIMEIADLYDRDEKLEAAKIIDRLNDETQDSRFGFDLELILAFVTGRIYGKLAAGVKQMIQDAEGNLTAHLKSLALRAEDEARVEQLREALQRQKEKDAEPIPEREHTAVNPTVRPMTGVTLKGKAERMISNNAGRLGIATHIDAASIAAGESFANGKDIDSMDDSEFKRIFSGSNILGYLLTTKNDLIASGVIKDETTN